ncbi:MAG: zinc transporter ZntB [Defluviicoccus sp.]|nr:zinc transporter ZntB [Defluviicoccus sp.]
MSDAETLIFAYALDGRGGASPLAWTDLPALSADRAVWIHLNLDSALARRWLAERGDMPDLAAETLFHEETRPRCLAIDDGLLLNLRGVNLDPLSDPEDMVSIRLFSDSRRIVSVGRRRLETVSDLRARLEAGRGPARVPDLLLDLCNGLLERMGPVVADLDDAIDAIEDRLLDDPRSAEPTELWALRRKAIALRRFIAPQRDAIARFALERVSWVDETAVQRARDAADRVTRQVEDLDAARERASVIQDELTRRLGERTNRNVYVLSVVAGIFLPLGLLAGLLGVNLGGIPGATWHWAFAVFVAALAVVGLAEFWLFRRFGWL